MQLPPKETWGCLTLRDIRISWKESDSDTYPDANSMYADASLTSATIMSLDSCVAYDVRVQLWNNAGLAGPMSAVMSGTTLTTGKVQYLS